jgi:uncharacterized protein (TIGR03437 family)
MLRRITFRSLAATINTLAVLIPASMSLLSGQVSSSAYRSLGQRDLRQNGLNMVEGLELLSPSAIALDRRGGQLRIYVSDTGNHRVLGWQDARSYQTGDAPTLVLGQPGRQFSTPLGIGPKGFNTPLGMAVHPNTGDLYVADSANSRVLRFADPFLNPSRVEPDAVYGQPDLNRVVTTTSNKSLNKPRSVAFDAAGNLWVADTGNHRILRFNAAGVNSITPPEADIVIGQRDFLGNRANAGGTAVSALGFDTPSGLAFDSQGNLYVSDFNNARVLKFSGPFAPSAQTIASSAVWGQRDFTTRGASPQASASTLAGPLGLSVDGSGNLYVAVAADNRVLVFGTDTSSAAAAKNVLGQSDFLTTTGNANVFPMASANTVSAPGDVKVDSDGSVFVADAGNNRVLLFSAGSKTATRLWGQTDFVANGPNQVKPSSINSPSKIAIDYSSQPFALYVSDANNHRVLVWKDSVRFRNGDPADLVIGQPDLRMAISNVDTRGTQIPSRTSLSSPRGIAVNPRDGSLYVADTANNRVLRYPRPVSQAGRITPDAVIGQFDFSSATSAAVSASSLRAPTAVALGPDGNLFVADSGNNRVLEFAAGAGTGAAAIRVYGQPNTSSSIAPTRVSAQTLAGPQGLFVDAAFNLYVADTGANRVLIFPNTQSAPLGGMAAAFVIGQNSFDVVSGGASGILKSPADVAVDSASNIYVADFGNNRVLTFAPLVFLPVAGGAASSVVGQRDLTGTTQNWNAANGAATAESLYGPLGLYVDRQDTLYVGDTGNNRVLHFLKAVAVVNSATFQSGVPVASGGLAALFGKEMATTEETTTGAPWPTSLAQREVVINDEIRSPLQYLSSTQVNFQIPSSAPLGLDRIAVRLSDTGELVAGGTLAISASSPGLFTSTQNGTGQAAAVNQDGRINTAANPAAKGSVIVLYGTGQGQVSPPVPDAMAAPSSPLSSTVTVPTTDGRACVTSQPAMCVAIGSTFGEVQYSGLTPGYVGLWQINVKIPADSPVGNAVPVRVLINGVPSNVVGIAIR